MKRLYNTESGFKQKVFSLFLAVVLLAGVGLLPTSRCRQQEPQLPLCLTFQQQTVLSSQNQGLGQLAMVSSCLHLMGALPPGMMFPMTSV